MTATAYARARAAGEDELRRTLLDTAGELLTREGPQALTSRLALETLEVASPNAAATARNALERAELIEKVDGRWHVSSGLFQRWLVGSYD